MAALGVVRPFVAFAFAASAFAAFVAFVVASSDAEPSAASVLVAFVASVAASFAAAWQDLRLVVAHQLVQG